MMLVGISSLLSSLDPEQRAKQSFPYEGSYVVELNRALVTPTFSLTRLQENNLLTDELKHEILSIDGVSGIVCQQEICVTIDGMETAIRSMNAEDYAALEHRVMAGELPHCDHTGENSLVINMGSPELDYLQKSYEAGDTITFSQAGNNLQGNLTYVVSAVVFDKNSASSFILPAAEMERAVPYNANSAFIIQTGDSGYIGIEDKLQSLTGASDSLRLKTLKDTTMQYKSVFSTISAAAYALLAVIITFSIINLVNTSMTNIISRRKEMGLFRAIGLDSKQLSHMIGFENGFQTFGSFAASVAGGLVIGKAICSAVGNVPGFSFVGYTFPIISVCFYFLLALALQCILTKWASLYCRQNSVVEQASRDRIEGGKSMTWPFENDTSAVIRKLSNVRLRQHHFRNRLIGVIIFMAAAIMAFVSSYAFNVTSEYAASTAYQGIFSKSLSGEHLPADSRSPYRECRRLPIRRHDGAGERNHNGHRMFR